MSDHEDDKYIVLSKNDWYALLPVLHHAHAKYRCNPADMPIEDAEVLRLQDITVAPIMHTYSSMIISFIELLVSRGMVSSEQVDQLNDIADWAHDCATRSERMDRRLPD